MPRAPCRRRRARPCPVGQQEAHELRGNPFSVFLTLHNERGGVQALPLGDFIIANRSALMRLVAPATCVAGEGPLKYVAYADIYIYILWETTRPL